MFNLPNDPRLWPNQPGFWESLAFFLLYAYTMVASLGDCYYTGEGLAKGLKEGNPLNHWLFGKIGQAGTTFLELAAVTFISGIIAFYSMPAAFIYLGAIAVTETFMVYRNRKLLGLKY
jgi:hypothetical protein